MSGIVGLEWRGKLHTAEGIAINVLMSVVLWDRGLVKSMSPADDLPLQDDLLSHKRTRLHLRGDSLAVSSAGLMGGTGARVGSLLDF